MAMAVAVDRQARKQARKLGSKQAINTMEDEREQDKVCGVIGGCGKRVEEVKKRKRSETIVGRRTGVSVWEGSRSGTVIE